MIERLKREIAVLKKGGTVSEMTDEQEHELCVANEPPFANLDRVWFLPAHIDAPMIIFIAVVMKQQILNRIRGGKESFDQRSLLLSPRRMATSEELAQSRALVEELRHKEEQLKGGVAEVEARELALKGKFDQYVSQSLVLHLGDLVSRSIDASPPAF